MPAEHASQPTNPHRDGKCDAAWTGHVCTLAAGHKNDVHYCFCSRRFFARHRFKPAAGAAAGCRLCGQLLLHEWHDEKASA